MMRIDFLIDLKCFQFKRFYIHTGQKCAKIPVHFLKLKEFGCLSKPQWKISTIFCLVHVKNLLYSMLKIALKKICALPSATAITKCYENYDTNNQNNSTTR